MNLSVVVSSLLTQMRMIHVDVENLSLHEDWRDDVE